MKNSPTNQYQQQKDLEAKVERINSLIEKIKSGVEAQEVAGAADPGSWGINSYLGYIGANLQDISDSLHGEGEYAE